MNNKLVVIGAGEFQLPLILKAKSLGYETHVFAWEDGAVAKAYADYFYPISIIEMDIILEKCKQINPCGVVSVGSDVASPTVCYLSEKLGLTSNSFQVAKKCINKYEMRKAFSDNNLPVPFYKLVDEDTNINYSDIPFPVIVKPTDRSGSRGITKVTQKEQLMPAIKQAIQHSFGKQAIIEEFIQGNEYSCECISCNGEHHFLALTKKFTTGAPHYIETGHIQPSDIKEEYKETIKQTIFSALTALGITNGASHTEFKIDEHGNIGIIEIGARMGGDCIGSDLVYLSTGYDFLKMVIDVACGNKVDYKPTNDPHTFAEIHFMFTEEDIKKLESIKNANPESIYRISNIDLSHLGNVTDSSTRLGYYITTA